MVSTLPRETSPQPGFSIYLKQFKVISVIIHVFGFLTGKRNVIFLKPFAITYSVAHSPFRMG